MLATAPSNSYATDHPRFDGVVAAVRYLRRRSPMRYLLDSYVCDLTFKDLEGRLEVYLDMDARTFVEKRIEE